MSAPSDTPPEDAPREVTPVDGPLDATVRPPGSKSITNRALVAAALADGTSTLRGALFADDTDAMVEALQRLGARVETDPAAERMVIHGTGGELAPGPLELDARLSGTTARFLLPILALGAGPYVLDGAPSLRVRPMADGIAAVRQLGVDVEELGEPGCLPVRVQGGPVHGGTTTVAGTASSQFLSGLLLAGGAMRDGLEVTVSGTVVSGQYVAMTEAIMAHFGARPPRTPNWTGPFVDGAVPAPPWVVPAGHYTAADLEIEPDASAASYFFAAAAICGGTVRVEGLSRHNLQGDVAFVDLLEEMGATVTHGEDYVAVTGPSRGSLQSLGTVDLGGLSDTAQTLAVVAVFADESTTVTDIGFIRHKESDRVGDTVRELRRCGIRAEEQADGFTVHPGTPQPTTVQTYDDHRMAMAFALLGLRAPGIRIADPGCVAKTFPRYWEVLDSLHGPPAR